MVNHLYGGAGGMAQGGFVLLNVEIWLAHMKKEQESSLSGGKSSSSSSSPKKKNLTRKHASQRHSRKGGSY
uniref:Uncharacterized protein n=1 Tax=Oryza punctata TaxID=4537 RepID=A0A0E0LB34_ORYPU